MALFEPPGPHFVLIVQRSGLKEGINCSVGSMARFFFKKNTAYLQEASQSSALFNYPRLDYSK